MLRIRILDILPVNWRDWERCKNLLELVEVGEAELPDRLALNIFFEVDVGERDN